jgi:superfamily II DNA or RNA helicase
MDIWDKIETLIDNNKKKEDEIGCIYHTREGTYIDVSKMPILLIKKIKRYFTISNKNIMGFFDHTSAWKQQGDKLYIPRFGSLFLEKKFKNVNYVNKITCDNPLPDMIYTGSLNGGNQELIFNHISNIFNKENVKSGRGGVIINLQAGYGKTFLGMYLIGFLKCRTLIVVHNSSILDQWYNHLTELFPNTKIGKYYGKKKEFGDITVGIINSLISDEINIKGMSTNPKEFYSKFDLILYDEAHEYCSKSRRKIYSYMCPYHIGLSATPNEREDKLDKINHWNIGQILDCKSIEGFIDTEVNFKGIVTKVCYSGNPDFTEHLVNEKLEMTSVQKMVEQITSDPYRLQMIIKLILEQHAKGLNILVFADRRNFLEEIQLELEKIKIEGSILDETNSIESIRLVGGSTSNEFELAKEKKNIILSTYQFMSTGVSVKKLNAIVLTTPRKNKSRQIINRIFRLGSDESVTRQIIDIVDVKISLKNQWYTRLDYYKEQNFEIIERKISWKEFE